MENGITPSFGDHVRIRSTSDTERRGLAGRHGSVSGFTTPSITGVEVVGASHDDYAIAVMFEEGPVSDAWFAEGLVEFIDHAPRTVLRVGNMKAVRRTDGSWEESQIDEPSVEGASPVLRRAWWKFWQRGEHRAAPDRRECGHTRRRVTAIVSQPTESLARCEHRDYNVVTMATTARIVRIGNSRGIRVPKALLEQAQLPEEVELLAEPGRLIVRAARRTRAGWTEAAAQMHARGDDSPLAPAGGNRFDTEEWEWR
jgi:antitoxin MazE